MNERIKMIREALGLSQDAFGREMGLTRSGVSNLEAGIRGVSEKHLKLLHHAFHVNEQWMRTGEGEMFDRSDSTLSKLVSEYGLDETDRALLESYLTLAPEQRRVIKEFMGEAMEKSR